MKKFLIIIAIFSIILYSYSQDTTKTFEYCISYDADLARNFYGGIKRGNAYMGLLTGELSINTEKFLKGGELVLRVMNTHGKGLSKNLIGDIQIASNIENGNYTFLNALYYKQQISKFQFSIGIQDLNEKFCISEYGANLTNSSFGIHSSFPLNFAVPIYPKTALGLLFFIKFNVNIILKNCIFDGDAGSLEDDNYNIKWDITKEGGLLFMSELEIKNNKNKFTSLKIGSFYHSGTFKSSEDTNFIKKNNYGFHFVFDKELFNKNSFNSGMFLQLAYVPNKINYNPLYIGAGLVNKGIIKNRKEDVFAVGVAYAQLYDKSYECDFEINYNLVINKNISIKPCLHYIVNPGANIGLKNSFSSFLRLSITL